MARILAAFFVACLLPAATRAQFPADSALNAVIKARIDAGGSTGIVVGLLEPDGRTRVLAYNERKHGEPAFDGRSVFEIGSITKTFTAALLVDLVARGEVKLDDPVAKYLPSTVKVPARGSKVITLLDLATQTSGLPRMPTNFRPANPANPFADYTVLQMYDFLSGYTLARDIGAQYEYSNIGMGLLGHALALRGGKSFEQLVHERILQPLGMTSTSITLSADQKARLARGHGQRGDTVPNWDIPAMPGAGALYSTVEDMLKYLRAQLQPASSEIAKRMAMTHEIRKPVSQGMNIGLAWHILMRPDRQITWHNGGTGGYRTFAGFDAKNRRAVVVLTNMNRGADDIGFHLLDPGIPLAPVPAATPPAPRREVSVPATVLQQYVGEYELAPDFTITITLEGDQLFGQATGQQRVRLWAESEANFFLKEIDAQVRFTRNAAGTVSMTLFQNGQALPGRKIR